MEVLGPTSAPRGVPYHDSHRYRDREAIVCRRRSACSISMRLELRGNSTVPGPTSASARLILSGPFGKDKRDAWLAGRTPRAKPTEAVHRRTGLTYRAKLRESC